MATRAGTHPAADACSAKWRAKVSIPAELFQPHDLSLSPGPTDPEPDDPRQRGSLDPARCRMRRHGALGARVHPRAVAVLMLPVGRAWRTGTGVRSLTARCCKACAGRPISAWLPWSSPRLPWRWRIDAAAPGDRAGGGLPRPRRNRGRLSLRWQSTARSVPPIHDISTNTVDPPTFERVVGPSRRRTEHARLRRQRRTAAAAGVFRRRAGDAARAARRRVRAGAERRPRCRLGHRRRRPGGTPHRSHRHDVLVRFQGRRRHSPEAGGDGTRVDVRSVSRVGRSDVGTNARRIREYLGVTAGGRISSRRPRSSPPRGPRSSTVPSRRASDRRRRRRAA